MSFKLVSFFTFIADEHSITLSGVSVCIYSGWWSSNSLFIIQCSRLITDSLGPPSHNVTCQYFTSRYETPASTSGLPSSSIASYKISLCLPPRSRRIYGDS